MSLTFDTPLCPRFPLRTASQTLHKGQTRLWFFVSFRIFFADNTRVRIFIFLSCEAQFFFQNLTLVYMTKTLKQIFFFLPQNQNIFFRNIGNQNFFFRKKTYPPPPFKLNGRSLNNFS